MSPDHHFGMIRRSPVDRRVVQMETSKLIQPILLPTTFTNHIFEFFMRLCRKVRVTERQFLN